MTKDHQHVESLILKKCEQEIRLLDEAINVVTDSLRRNTGKLRRQLDTEAPEAVAALFAKGWKTIQAIKVLALKGYGQDAMGLLRSLTNLTIDMAYMAIEDSEERVGQWAAFAHVQRARLAREMDIALSKEETPDDQMQIRANKWSGLKIRGRANAAGLMPFYTLPYRLGSPFEHSDAWSVSGYLREKGENVVLDPEPASDMTCPPLGGALLYLGVMFEVLGRFFAFDFDADIQKLKGLQEALPTPTNS